MSGPASPHVVKVGGSLLGRADLPESLRRWLAQQPRGDATLLVVGGGGRVDALRARCAAGQLTDAAAHWLAIDAMDANGRALADRVGIPWVAFDGATPIQGDAVLRVRGWLEAAEPHVPGPRLGRGWSVTSDSIAARLAGVLGARLTLLKSAPPPACASDHAALAAAGYVDASFPRVALGVAVVAFETLPRVSG